MKDIGIDLGTANVLIFIKKEGVVLNEPSVVAIDSETKKVLAVGEEASQMIGRTPGKVKAIRPLRDGVIADFEMTELMLEEFIKKIKGKTTFSKPRILICCPANVTPVEKNAIREVAERMGARRVYMEEEPKAAAIGAGLDITKPKANMVIDIGGGTTDIAILSLNGIVTSASIRMAGTSFDEEIKKFLKDKYKLLIGDKTAEEIKIGIGNLNHPDKKETKEVRGRDLISGLPHTVTVTAEEIGQALTDCVNELVREVKNVLEKTPPELASDIVESGIVLTGGGALLKGLPQYLSKELKVPVFAAESPLTCVAEGCGILLDHMEWLETQD